MPSIYTSTHKLSIPDRLDFAAALLDIALDATRPVGVSRAAAAVLIALTRRDGLLLADLVDHLARQGEGKEAK